MNRNSQVIIESIVAYRTQLARSLDHEIHAISEAASAPVGQQPITPDLSNPSSILLNFAVDICKNLMPKDGALDEDDLRQNLPPEIFSPKSTSSGMQSGFPLQGALTSETVIRAFNEVYLHRQTGILERIAGGDSIGCILDEIVESIEEQIPGTNCSILLLDQVHKTLHVASARSLPKEYNDAIEGVLIGPNVGSCGTAAYRQIPVFVGDIENDPLWKDFRGLALQFGLRSCWSIPILSRSTSGEPDGVIGTFALYSKQVGLPNAKSEELLWRAERLASVAIKADQVYRSLREHESRFKLEQGSPDAAWLTGPGGVIVDVNQSACSLLGFSREELIGRNQSDVEVHHDESSEQVQLLDPVESDLRYARSCYRRKIGPPIHVTYREHLFTIDGSRFNLTLFRDDTLRLDSRGKAQDEFRKLSTDPVSVGEFVGAKIPISPRIQKAILEQIGEGLLILAPNGTVMDYNSAALGLINAEHASVFSLGRSSLFGPYCIFDPSVAPLPESDIPHRRLLDGQTFSNVEAILKIPGSVDCRTFLFSGSQILADDGQVECRVLTYRDITSQRMTEGTLRENEMRLAEAQEIGRIGSFEIDLLSWKGQCSRALNRIFGFSDEEGYQKFLEFLASRTPRDDASTILTMTDFENASEHEYHYLHPDDQDRTVCIRRHAVRDQMGRVVKVIGTAQDITERRNAEDALRHLQAQLQHSLKMEAVGRLAGGVAHDFNNLLTVINGYCEILSGKIKPGEAFYDPIRAIRDAGERATRLTEQLLAFSRKAVFQPQNMDLNATITKMDILLGRLIGEDIQLSLDLAPNLPAIVADPGQLEQVIMNLAVNARDAMIEGGSLKIATRLCQETNGGEVLSGLPLGNYVELQFEDSGCGIPLDLQQKIFEPFFTTKDSSKGSGLGLSVVHGIVAQLGGKICVESRVGSGSIFKLYFPVSDEVSKETAATSVSKSVPGSETILLVEDEDAVRAIARISLEASGYKVFEASNSKDALRLLELHADNIGFLVTDIVLPEMGGYRLAEIVHEKLPNLPCLFISGYAKEIIDRNGSIPADQILNKPFLPHDLAQRVRKMLDTEK
jgi:PAS domain S-box-containing protein